MFRTLLIAATTSTSLLVVPIARHRADACQLLTAKDASALAGSAVSRTHGGSTNCVYNGPGGPASLGVEINVRTYADADAAHAAFPRWVLPFRGPNPNLTVTPVAKVGDEASMVRGPIASGIYFRHGAALVKIGSHPPVGDAALQAAAQAVIGRL